ncbi:MAG: hypothetical protein V1702_00720 [Candidatus Woesearchaeota archaeon]
MTLTDNFQMVEHYVGHGLLKARAALSKKDKAQADLFRMDLVAKLEKLSDDPLVSSCLGFLRGSDWGYPDSVERFAICYDGLIEQYHREHYSSKQK